MAEEVTIGADRPGGCPPRTDPYVAIESASAEWALAPHGAESRALRERLICRCQPLAEHIALGYTVRGEIRGEIYEELLEAARLGVVLAVDRFDRTQGESFLAFAIPMVLDEVRGRFRDDAWVPKILRRVQEIQATIRPTVEAVTHRLGRVPTAREVCAHLDADLLEVTRALVIDSCSHTFSARFGTERDTFPATAAVFGAGADENPEYEMIMRQMVLPQASAALSEIERWVVYLRFFRSRTQAQIAAQTNIPQLQVHRMLSDALDRLRESTAARE